MAKLSDYIGNVRRFENNPAKAGQRVRRQGYLFGFDGGSATRFCLFAIHTRFGERGALWVPVKAGEA